MAKRVGRPITNYLVREILRERRCSVTWAYELLRRERAGEPLARRNGRPKGSRNKKVAKHA
jgi:hypothetical protein